MWTISNKDNDVLFMRTCFEQGVGLKENVSFWEFEMKAIFVKNQYFCGTSSNKHQPVCQDCLSPNESFSRLVLINVNIFERIFYTSFILISFFWR